MTVRALLGQGFANLKEGRIETPYLDAVVLLAEVMHITKEQLFQNLSEEASVQTRTEYRIMLSRRLDRYPVSYLRKKKEFFSLPFYVDERVMVPRPETEIIVEAVIELAAENKSLKRIHDVCTGSGCVAISLKKWLMDSSISASDISEAARDVFEHNCRTILGEPLPFYLCSLMKGVPGKFDIIAANPPYLAEAEIATLRSSCWPEPEIALDGGKNGLEIIEELVSQAGNSLKQGGYLLIEAAPDQMEPLGTLMKNAGFEISFRSDLAGRLRVAHGKKVA